MPTTFSMAFPAIATITSPAKVSLIPRLCMAGSSASTNQSETNAAAILEKNKTITAKYKGQILCFSSFGSSFSARMAAFFRREKNKLPIKIINNTIDKKTFKVFKCPSAFVCSKLVRVGMANTAKASNMRMAIVLGGSDLKTCVPLRKPPTKRAIPNTKTEFPKIDPINAAYTTATRPALSAKMQTNNSGRLPKADCKIPVAAGPNLLPNCSVASPTIIANNARAPAVTIKARIALACE